MKIKEYIQFAIDNDYLFKNGFQILTILPGRDFYIDDENIVVEDTEEGEILDEFNLYQQITSKEFIEAIARGLEKQREGHYFYFKNTTGFIILDRNDKKISIENIIKRITNEQAIAIRENNLPEFITQILK